MTMIRQVDKNAEESEVQDWALRNAASSLDTDFILSLLLPALLRAQPSIQRSVHPQPAHQAQLPTSGPEGDLGT